MVTATNASKTAEFGKLNNIILGLFTNNNAETRADCLLMPNKRPLFRVLGRTAAWKMAVLPARARRARLAVGPGHHEQLC